MNERRRSNGGFSSMMRFFTSSVRRQLIGVLTVLVAVFVVALIVGLSAVGSVDSHIRSIASKQNALLQATGNSRDLQGSEARALLDPSRIADHLADVATFRETLQTMRGYAHTPAARGAMAQLDTAFSRWAALDSQVMSYARARQLAQGTRFVIGQVNAAGDQLTAAVASAGNAITHDESTAAEATASSSRTLMLLAGGAALLLAAGLGLAITRRLTGGVKRALARITQMTKAIEANLVSGLEALAGGDLTRSLHAVTKPEADFPGDEIGEILRTTEHLRASIIVAYDAYNTATEKLRAMIGGVSSTASSVGAASQEMSCTSEEAGKATGEIAHAVGDVAQGAERQVTMLEQARHAAEDVARAVAESARNAQQTAEVAHDTRAIAQQGVGAAEQADQAMRSVRDSSAAVTTAIDQLAGMSEQIGHIVQTITGIAQQTNLLALNAAIEAARAGEQGKGFAVVAEEVRKLAEESQHAAQEISQLITAIQGETTNAVNVVKDGAQRTEQGAGVVEQTREAFQKIGASVDDMTARIEHIAAVSQQIAASAHGMQEHINEIAAVAQQSSASTQEVSASTEQTSASTEQIAASAQQLASNAEHLNELVAQFKTAA